MCGIGRDLVQGIPQTHILRTPGVAGEVGEWEDTLGMLFGHLGAERRLGHIPLGPHVGRYIRLWLDPHALEARPHLGFLCLGIRLAEVEGGRVLVRVLCWQLYLRLRSDMLRCNGRVYRNNGIPLGYLRYPGGSHLGLDHMGLVGEDMRMRTLFLLGVRRLRPVQEEGDRVELEP